MLFYQARNTDKRYSAVRHQINQIECIAELTNADKASKMTAVSDRMKRIVAGCDVASPEWYQLISFSGMEAL